MQRLIIMDDAGETSSIPLIQDEISIGREDGNVLRLTQRNISRRHARLVREDGVLYVEDLDSYNGVYVNGDRILGRVELRDGDELQVGDYQLMIQRAGLREDLLTPLRPLHQLFLTAGRTTLVLRGSAEEQADDPAGLPPWRPVPRRAAPLAAAMLRVAIFLGVAGLGGWLTHCAVAQREPAGTGQCVVHHGPVAQAGHAHCAPKEHAAP